MTEELRRLTCIRLLITGRVQGVGYRYSMRRQAELAGVAGWCRNLPDGAVEAVVQGLPEQVEAVAVWCAQGPPHASVVRIERRDEPVGDSLSSFEIRL